MAFESMPTFQIVLLIGLFIRLLLIGNPGFLADIAFWKSWSLAAYDHGIVWTSLNTNINYPPGFIYILWIIGKLYSFLGNPHDFNSYWQENNFAFLFVAKSVAIASDVFIAWLIYWFFSQNEKIKQFGIKVSNSNHLPLILSSIFFLNPVVIIDSALWGQVESFGLMFTLVAIILLIFKRPHLATVIFTIGTLMKLQNIIFIPLFFIFLFRYYDLKTLVKCLVIAVSTFFIVNLPFILQTEMKQVLMLMTINSDYFPWMSLNAHNIWWIVSKAQGLHITDRITVLGILNAKTVGLVIFSSFYFILCLLLFLKTTPKMFITTLILGIFAFFLFTTQSHERYSYPVVVLLLFIYPFIVNQTPKVAFEKSSQVGQSMPFVKSNYFFWSVYLLLSLLIFFNIHFSLIYNYQNFGISALTRITTPALTILSSYLHLILFLILFFFLLKKISFVLLSVPFILIFLGLFTLNIKYLTSGKISLRQFKPIIANQEYGSLQVNKSVNSVTGWKSWNRLSNNYYFYRNGFGTHANSKLVFDVDRKFNKFVVDIGIDSEAGTQASALFQIFGDGKELFTSTKMGRFDFPKHVEVDIKGIKFLGLETNDSGDGRNDDHTDWLNPILLR